ncbi:Appr-1-p processing protein [Streptomyces sp. NBC_00264]|uniref:macro domain-containing protein n=1 Tax=unclassified Streptomyces TaxID=2593676 RepID=UPI00225B0995|nr:MULTISPECIES: Appr-1-p processing protein [unclassified Streptomyces]MCX5161339.1 Appr-1-p processing protein [Streptomyces sp. NBC_00305]MCX5219862.1 Appr-1-p processing protein [Streptomyces sp. NBC_00264]
MSQETHPSSSAPEPLGPMSPETPPTSGTAGHPGEPPRAGGRALLPLPGAERLAAELRALRRPGLSGLRTLRPEALIRVAVAAGLCGGSGDEAAGVEMLLKAGVRHLGGRTLSADGTRGDPLARAAAHTFGLLPDWRGVSGQERRKAAAAVYGVTSERFRKSQEQEVIAELALAVLTVARSAITGPPAPVPAGGPEEAAPSVRTPDPVPDPPTRLTGPPLPAAAVHRVTVHVASIELLRDIDILVSSENIYLEMSKTFRSTVSGSLRRAAAIRDEAGETVDDVLARELVEWMRAHGRSGLPVRPGTVVPTSPGALAQRGVRRIHHAAVASPTSDGHGYRVDPHVLAEAVSASFRLARAERDRYDPPLSSLCFPLLGAGHGLPPEKAARWLCWAVHEELSRDPSWTVHLVAQRPELAKLLTAASSAP